MAKTTSKTAKPLQAQPTPAKRRKKKGKRGKRKLLTPLQIEQNLQKKEIRNLLSNIGFTRGPNIEGKDFNYDGRTAELDDVFLYENVILFVEYTIGDPGTHLIKKKVIFDKINDDPRAFMRFVQKEDRLKALGEFIKKDALTNYTINQFQVKILYASKSAISREHKDNVNKVCFFDYSIVKYFESIAKVIKKTTRYEFFEFLQIPLSKVGAAIKATAVTSAEDFSGHILPEEKSSFKEGYKLVSFYIDAASLLRRAYVLRKDGWKNSDNIGLYQRMLLPKKIKGMRKYLNDKTRVFVNNIIVTLPLDKIKLTGENGKELKIDANGNFKDGSTNVTPATINIENQANIIGIIDGQHRSYAYHEGDDVYEGRIAELRNIQNLLVTGILYPKNEEEEKRLKFEAQLFLEINSNQAGASTPLKQEIEFMLTPFSTTSISKHVVNKLNESGPLGTLFERYWYEKAKIKTASIISFGLRPLVKLDGDDTLFKIWKNAAKADLKGENDFTALREYKEFCSSEVRNIFIGLKANIDNQNWKVDRNDPNAVLNVTTIIGVINCLRILVQNNQTGNANFYIKKFANVKTFPFKRYKSSQYRKMGQDLYDKYFKLTV